MDTTLRTLCHRRYNQESQNGARDRSGNLATNLKKIQGLQKNLKSTKNGGRLKFLNTANNTCSFKRKMPSELSVDLRGNYNNIVKLLKHWFL